MIRPGDRVSLAAGVAVGRTGLSDVMHAGGEIVVLNPTACGIAARFDGRRVSEVADALVLQYGIDAARAQADVTALAAELNRRLLVNVEPHTGELARIARWIGEAARGIPLLIVPRLRDLPSARWPLPADRRLARLAVVARRVAPRTALLGGGLVLPLVLALGLFGALRADVPLVVLLGMIVGLVAHEAGHALALRRGPVAIGLSGLTMSIMHPPLPSKERAVVAACGPLAAALTGWALLVAATLLSWPPLALAASISTTQALGLTVLGHDGRNSCAPS